MTMPPPAVDNKRDPAEAAPPQRVPTNLAAPEGAADDILALFFTNYSIFLLQFLTIAFEINQHCTETGRIWVFGEDGGGTLPQNDPAERPPPEIAELGGACGSIREIRGWQRKAARAMPLRGCARSQGAPWVSILGPFSLGWSQGHAGARLDLPPPAICRHQRVDR